MTGLTKLALKRPVSICMAVLALLVFGLSSAATAPMELMPDIEMPVLLVMTQYVGAAPEDVEDQVTQYIEDAAETLSGVKNVESTSMEHASVVILEMEYGTDMDEARNDLTSNLEIQKTYLPDDADDPTIIEMSVDTMPIMMVSATAAGDVDLKYYVEEEIQPEIERLGGVASVSVSGGTTEYIKIALKEEALSQHRLDLATVAALVSTADFSLPAGSMEEGGLDLTLRGGVEYDSLQLLRGMPLTLATGDVIHLSDIADVYVATPDMDSLSYCNGSENVLLQISKRQSAPTLATTDAIMRKINEINSSDMGVNLEVIFSSSDDIKSAIQSVIETLMLGVILAMIVLFIFFGDWRASLIVGSSIPLSLLVTLIAMSFMGFSYNMLSLGGLVIGVGMMVDNSIVVIENCFRVKSRSKDYYEAALDGAREVANSIAAGTITTVVVFLPIALTEGMSGQLFKQLCFTIVFSLIASLISAITIVPLTFYWLKPQEKEPKAVMRFMDRLSTAYAKFLPKTFKCKWLVVTVSVALLIGAFAMIPLIGIELMPVTDDGIIEITMDVRPGTTLERINEFIKPVEEMVASHPDVEKYTMTSGGSGITVLMGGSEEATMTVYLKDDRSVKTDDLVDIWREETKNSVGYDIGIESTSQMSQMTGTSDDLTITIQGMDFDDLGTASEMIEAHLKANPYLAHVGSTLSSGTPQAEVVIDPVKAASKGLVPMQVMGNLYTIMEGIEAFDLIEDGREYEVRVEYPEGRYDSISELASLSFTNAAGIQVPLLDIAEIEYSNSPLSITRKNGSYILDITAQELAGAPDKLEETIKAEVRELELPDGVELTQNTEDERIQEEFTTLITAIAAAVFLVFIVMAMQFESPVFSGIVMVSLPFAMIGSMISLLVFDCTISMTSLMGFLMLVGTAVNNGILFIDTANALRAERNLPIEDATLSAAMLRMRPMFMTTLTTVFAMVPMALGYGDNGEVLQGMGVVVIGGLIASTILTLVLMPTFYLLCDKSERKRRKDEKKAKRLARKEAKASI